MKREAIILVALLYLLPAIGFSINIHWCGNKIKAVNIATLNSSTCSCGKKMPMKCCKNIHQVIKLTDSQKATSQLIVSNKNLVKLFFGSSFQIQQIPNSQVNVFDFTNYHAPPFKSKLPVYLNCCVFRI